MIDLTPIVNAAIALIAALIAWYVIPWLRRHTTEKEREELLRWAAVAVRAAEQAKKETDGAGRKSYVQTFLQSKGFDVNDAAVDAAIEAAVLEMNQAIKGGRAGADR